MNADRVFSDLRRLDELTGGPSGADRICWGDGWKAARELLRSELDAMPVEVDVDPAGNLWAVLPGRVERTVVMGSHLDSVPHGGPLDGALGVLAGLEVLRSWAAAGEAPCRLALVDWADEEGVRFGRSLFGSSAVAGRLDTAGLAGTRDAAGRKIEDVLADAGVRFDAIGDAALRRPRIDAYVELHIEQGPVLERGGFAAAAVSGTAGSKRGQVAFRGQAAHAGTTPMELRRDALTAAARFTLAIRDAARANGGVATVGQLDCVDGAANVVPGRVELVLDQRHPDADRLAAMGLAADRACAEAAEAEGVSGEVTELWTIEPVAFDAALVSGAQAACQAAGSDAPVLVSGALHDASEIARLAPAVMLFAPSKDGLSHCPEEFTAKEDLAVAFEAFAGTVSVAAQQG